MNIASCHGIMVWNTRECLCYFSIGGQERSRNGSLSSTTTKICTNEKPLLCLFQSAVKKYEQECLEVSSAVLVSFSNGLEVMVHPVVVGYISRSGQGT